jgi:hypothetical protein
VQLVRAMNLLKPPGIAETLDLSQALAPLKKNQLDPGTADQILGCILKSADDLAKIRRQGLENLLSRITPC